MFPLRHKLFYAGITLCMSIILVSSANADEWQKHWSPAVSASLNDIDSDPKAVIQTARAALANMAEGQLDTSLARSEWLFVLSQAYYAQVKADEALMHAEQGMALTEREQQPWIYFNFALAKANALDLLGVAEQGIVIANEVVQWSEKHSPTLLYQQALITRGLLQLTLGQNRAALKDFFSAEALSELPNTETKGHIASFIALVYEYRGEDQLAIPYFDRASKHYREQSKWLELSNATYGLGKALRSLGQFGDAEKALVESLDLSRQIDDEQGEAYTLKELALVQLAANDIAKARQTLTDSIALFEQTQNPYMMLNTHLILADIESTDGRPEQAIQAIDTAISYVTGESMQQQRLSALSLKAKVLAEANMFEQAYQVLLETKQLERTIREKKNEIEFQRLQTEYEVEKQKVANSLLLTKNQQQQVELDAKSRSRTLWIITASLSAILCALMIIMVVTNRRHQKHLEKLANYDPLTGLMSRRFTLENLEKLLALSRRHNDVVSIAIVDLDHFKKINDVYGHACGDAVLREFGERAMNSFRESDLIGRIGGEEFLFVFPRTNAQHSKQKLIKFSAQIESICRDQKISKAPVTISAGLIEAFQHNNIGELLQRADEALYQAKTQGRNQVVITGV